MAQGYWLNHLYVQELKSAKQGKKYHGKITLSDKDSDEELRELLNKFMSIDNSEEWQEVIPEEALNWLKDYVPKLAGVLSEDVLEKTREVLRDSMMRGTTLQERMKALRESSDTLLKMTDARIESIARTEITRADSMGRLISMKGNEDVIGFEFSAIMDDRTTEMCAERHGLIMRLDDPRVAENTPPLHVRCRSMLLSLTVYDYPDGVLTSHEFDEVPSGIQRENDIEEVRSLLGGIESAVEETVSSVEMIQGVSKTRIDELRGLRGHEGKQAITEETVKKDYERVGINVSEEYAHEVHKAIYDFSRGKYEYMRDAFLKNKRGEDLDEDEKEYLRRYALCGEYAKIAPTYEGTGSEIYRGIVNSGSKYSQRVLSLKVGDTFNLEMPSSFSSDKDVAKDFAGRGGIIFHISDTDLLNSPSISGIADIHAEYEILVSDFLWEVVKIDPQGIDNRYHITLKRKTG